MGSTFFFPPSREDTPFQSPTVLEFSGLTLGPLPRRFFFFFLPWAAVLTASSRRDPTLSSPSVSSFAFRIHNDVPGGPPFSVAPTRPVSPLAHPVFSSSLFPQSEYRSFPFFVSLLLCRRPACLLPERNELSPFRGRLADRFFVVVLRKIDRRPPSVRAHCLGFFPPPRPRSRALLPECVQPMSFFLFYTAMRVNPLVLLFSAFQLAMRRLLFAIVSRGCHQERCFVFSGCVIRLPSPCSRTYWTESGRRC